MGFWTEATSQASLKLDQNTLSFREAHAQPEGVLPLCVFTIQSLDALDVVGVQLDFAAVTAVHRPHQGAVVLRVSQAQSVADLMGCDDPQVGARSGPLRPRFVLVKVHDAGLWGVSVGQNAA